MVLGLLAWCGACETATPMDAGERDAGPPCIARADCDDGVFCNGSETCRAFRCEPGPPPCFDVCDEGGRGCGDCLPADADGDGHAALACGGDDCDDADPDRFPGNLEMCDERAVDEDCIPATVGIRDLDGDGETSSVCCNEAEDRRVCGPDCDDERDGPSTMGPETCDGADQDCDGTVDEEATCVLPFAIGACVEGRCSVVSCPDERMNCNASSADGCERDVLTDRFSCGNCDVRCGPMQTCVLGRCEGSPCPLGTHACPTGCERDDAVTSCGSRCTPCPTIEGGEALCESGVCDVRCPVGDDSSFDSEGRPICVRGFMPSIRGIDVVTDTDTHSYTTPFPDLIRARVASPLVTLIGQTRGVDPDFRFRIGTEERAGGEPFDPVDVLAGRAFQIEVLFRGVVTQRIAIDVYFEHEPVVLGEGIPGLFGAALAIDGDVLVVGAPLDASDATGVDGDRSDTSEPGAGAAYVYERRAVGWVLAAYLKPFLRIGASRFGTSVAVRGDTIAIGAPYAAGPGAEPHVGAAFVFRRIGGDWSPLRRLEAPTSSASTRFGSTVGISADEVLVATRRRLYAYRVSDGTRTEVGPHSGVMLRVVDGIAASPSSSYVLGLYRAAPWSLWSTLPLALGTDSSFDVDAAGRWIVMASPQLRVWSPLAGGWTLSDHSTESAALVATDGGTLVRDSGTRIVWSPVTALREQQLLERPMRGAAAAADMSDGVAVFGGGERVFVYDNRAGISP
jgi:hypothetical protein